MLEVCIHIITQVSNTGPLDLLGVFLNKKAGSGEGRGCEGCNVC